MFSVIIVRAAIFAGISFVIPLYLEEVKKAGPVIVGNIILLNPAAILVCGLCEGRGDVANIINILTTPSLNGVQVNLFGLDEAIGRRMPIPLIPDTRSDLFRTVILIEGGQSFRFIPDTLSERSDAGI
jgi:hypothetical protein